MDKVINHLDSVKNAKTALDQEESKLSTLYIHNENSDTIKSCKDAIKILENNYAKAKEDGKFLVNKARKEEQELNSSQLSSIRYKAFNEGRRRGTIELDPGEYKSHSYLEEMQIYRNRIDKYVDQLSNVITRVFNAFPMVLVPKFIATGRYSKLQFARLWNTIKFQKTLRGGNLFFVSAVPAVVLAALLVANGGLIAIILIVNLGVVGIQSLQSSSFFLMLL